jgi:methylmalonyl-CoA mutase N-terminal domain/subunit
VGVNRYVTDEASSIELLQIDPESERRQAEGVRKVRQSRDSAAWRGALDAVERSARDGTNLVPPVIAAVEARATLGEIADTLRGVFGEHREIST